MNIVDVFNALQWIEPSESLHNTAKSANVIIGFYSTIREFYNNHGLVTGILVYFLVYGFIAFCWVMVSSAGRRFGLKSFEFVTAQKKLLLPQGMSDTLIAAVITSAVAFVGVILTILTK